MGRQPNLAIEPSHTTAELRVLLLGVGTSGFGLRA
jgi:hypothetical protein